MLRFLAPILLPLVMATPAVGEECSVPSGATLLPRDALVRATTESLALKKDELETTEQHQNRQLARFNEGLAPLTLKPGDVVVLDASFGSSVTYNADTRTAELRQLHRSYKGLSSLQYPESRHHAIVIDNNVSESTYETTNGFGAPVTVRRENIVQVAFAWPADVVHSIGDGGFDQPLRMQNFAPERVRQLREGGRYRVIGQLGSPLLRATFGPGVTPTFRMPLERNVVVGTVTLVPMAVCHLDESGQVLSQWKIRPRR